MRKCQRTEGLTCAVRAIDCSGESAADKVIAGLEWIAANYRLPAVASLSLGAAFGNELLDAALLVHTRSLICLVCPAFMKPSLTHDTCSMETFTRKMFAMSTLHIDRREFHSVPWLLQEGI